jgi:peptide/nickel transport system permease protein
MASAFSNTLILALMASAFAWLVGIISGIIAAVKKNSILDHLFMGVSLLGVSMPVFMAAMVLQFFFSYKLKIFPIAGTQSFAGFILPAVALGWNSAGSVARLVRSTLLEILEEDYIDTARAKGRRQMGVLILHAMRNAMLPVITMMAIQLSGMLSGAVLTETIFSINGIGRLAVQAITGRDIPLLQGTVLFSAALVILGNFLADSLYHVLDPRIRKEA